MTKEINCHRDCINFAPIDVAKGICHRTKEIIQSDAGQCTEFRPIAKCKRCSHYTAEEGSIELGYCIVSLNIPPFPAYPDMVATTCADYEELR
jgi:4-hydroxyphenylacetate decarboxylase small subunit